MNALFLAAVLSLGITYGTSPAQRIQGNLSSGSPTFPLLASSSGSAAAPAYSYAGNANTGTYYDTSNTAMAWSINSNEVFWCSYAACTLAPSGMKLQWSGATQLLSAANGVLQLTESGGANTTGTDGYQIGPSSTSGVRFTQQVGVGGRGAVRFADNSGYASMVAAGFIYTAASGGITDVNGHNGLQFPGGGLFNLVAGPSGSTNVISGDASGNVTIYGNLTVSGTGGGGPTTNLGASSLANSYALGASGAAQAGRAGTIFGTASNLQLAVSTTTIQTWTSTGTSIAGTLAFNALTASYSANQTLTTAQSGATVFFTGSTASQTITLPTAAVGLVYEIANNASVAVSVTAAGTITGGTLTTGSTRSLPAAARIKVVCDGTNWSMTSIVGSVS